MSSRTAAPSAVLLRARAERARVTSFASSGLSSIGSGIGSLRSIGRRSCGVGARRSVGRRCDACRFSGAACHRERLGFGRRRRLFCAGDTVDGLAPSTRLRAFFIGEPHHDAGDRVAAPARALGDEFEAGDRRRRTGNRHPPKRLREQTAHGLDGVIVFDLDVEQLCEFVDRQPGGDPHTAVGESLDAAGLHGRARR